MGTIESNDGDAGEQSPQEPRGCVHDVRIEHLLSLFYGDPEGSRRLAEFTPVDSVPPPFDRLLDHHEHMTVTVEAFHAEPVDVVVHRSGRDGHWYCREITLVGSRTGKVVQYGIVRLDINTLEPVVWQRIESQSIPLGRVLIEHNVLREVQLQGLWEVRVGEELAKLLAVPLHRTVFGRTALIYCNGEPAIELLEIVSGA